MTASAGFRRPSIVKTVVLLTVITLCYLGFSLYTERRSHSFVKPYGTASLENDAKHYSDESLSAPYLAPIAVTSSTLIDGTQDVSKDVLTDNTTAVVAATHTPIPKDEQTHANQASGTPEVAIVVATTASVNTSWISEFFPTWSAYIYSVDDPTAALTVRNRGREGSAYLSYIIDHYGTESETTGGASSLAKNVVFHHPDRFQWHNDDHGIGDDAVPVLQRIKFSRVDEDGFINLRCDLNPGCEDKEPRKPTTVWNKDAGGIQWLTLFGRALEELKPYELGPDPSWPELVQSPCCAQFVVSRKQILKVPKARYEQIRSFLYDWHFRKYVPEFEGDVILGENITTESSEGAIAGGLLEFMWHMIFGRPAVNCMPVGECDCRNFGICDVFCDDEDGC